MSSTAALRAADALLRSLGGAAVSLRIPSALLSSGVATEIGLTPLLYQDVPLAPAVLRPLVAAGSSLRAESARSTVFTAATRGEFSRAEALARYELLISATAVQEQIELNNFSSADDLFASALGLVYNGDLLRIENVAREDFAGAAYLYRITASIG